MADWSHNGFLILLLSSGGGGGRDERSPLLLHPPLLHPGPGGAGSSRADRVRPLEGKQTQALLLMRTQQVIDVGFQNVCFLIDIHHNNAKTAIAPLKRTNQMNRANNIMGLKPRADRTSTAEMNR